MRLEVPLWPPRVAAHDKEVQCSPPAFKLVSDCLPRVRLKLATQIFPQLCLHLLAISSKPSSAGMEAPAWRRRSC